MFKRLYEFRDRWNRKSYYERAEYIFGLLVKYVLITFVIIAALTICPIPAHAAANDITADSITAAAMSAGDPDISGMGILRKIFGGLVDNPLNPSAAQGVGETALGKVFGVINMSLMALGSIWLTYNLMAGVAQTANDGELLGKRFSSLWIPIRLVSGIVSLVPVFHGWALSQLVVVYFAVAGIGIGNLATAEVAKYLDQGGTIVNTPVTRVNQKFVTELYKINLCVSALNAMTENKPFSKQIVGEIASYGLRGDNQCGAVQLPQSRNSAAKNASRAAFDLVDTVVKAHTDKLVADVVAATQEDITKQTKTIANLKNDADIKAYSDIYQTTLRRNLAAALGTQTHLTADLINTGFIGLGAYYSKMSGAADVVNEAAQTQASILKAAPLQDFAGNIVGELYKHSLIIVDAFDRNTGTSLDALKNPSLDESVLITAFLSKAESSIPQGCNGKKQDVNVGQGMLARVIDATGCDPSPLNRMKTTGDYLSVLSMIGVGVVATAKGFAGAVPFAGEALKVFADIFLTLMQTLTFFAMMLSAYLPLIPYIAWMGAILSWVTVVIEGVVAAPLWAFAHLDTEGEGMGARTERGYTFLLNVLLRPVLMVVGFLTMTIVMAVVGKIFFSTFSLAVSESSAGSFTGLIAFVIYVGIFLTTSVMIVNQCANLIHIVPDTVLVWITQSTSSTGAGSGMNAHFAAAATGVTGFGAEIARNSIDKYTAGKARSKKTSGGDTGGGGSGGTGGDPYKNARNKRMA